MPTNLSLFDMLCLLGVALSCLTGFWRGFAFEVLAVAAWAGAFFSAQWGSVLMEQLLPAQWLAQNAQARYALIYVLTFIASLFLLGWCAALARGLLGKTGLRPFDRVLGAGFGLLRALLLLWVHRGGAYAIAAKYVVATVAYSAMAGIFLACSHAFIACSIQAVVASPLLSPRPSSSLICLFKD